MSHFLNAKITSTSLGYEDHGIFTCSLCLEGDGWGGNYGGYALDSFDRQKGKRVGTAMGFDAVIELMKTLEVETWESLKGKYVRCKFDRPYGKIVSIGHLMKERWFSFEDFFAEVTE